MADTSSIRKSKKSETDDEKEKKETKPELHDVLEEYDLELIHDIFTQRKPGRFDQATLKNIVETVSKLSFTDEEFNVIFMRMNSKRDGYVDWDEFISYLILEFEQKDVKAVFETLENPIPTAPTMIRSNHRYTINRIIYCPTVRPDRSISWHDGSLMTCSRDGTINYWSLDVQFERSVKSTCPNLRVQSTWVTDMVALPDVSVVCTSSTERDLRFYDTSARKFELRVIFTSIENPIYTMNYWFSDDPNEESKLVAGDMKGNIHVILIESVARGPFRSQLGLPLLEVRYDKVMKGLVNGFRVIYLPNQHSNTVLQIYYYKRLNSIISCSECPKVGMQMRDLAKSKGGYVYNLPKGAWCFSIIDGVQILASGSSDCLVRIWNPFVPQNPIVILYGHHTAIVSMILQDDGKFLYSLSQDKSIRVWDVAKQACVQNYLGIPAELGEHSDMTTLYNPESRQWIIGSTMLAVVPLSPKQSGEHTDGFTHTSGVSVVLYNPLYKVIITCGLDSHIIVWNPWDGRRMIAIREAHTKSVHAEIIPIEITAATFDPGYQRLVTGAHDGTLKVWNFNTGTCKRNMRIEKNCEVKRIIWVNDRILVMGFNRRVTEFGDRGDIIGVGGEFFKNWDLRHKEDISAAVVRVPQTVVTGTYDGELIMWRLETGQPYKQFNVADPTSRIKIYYKKTKQREEKKRVFDKKKIIARALGKAVREEKRTIQVKKPKEEEKETLRPVQSRRSSAFQRLTDRSAIMNKLRGRRVSTVPMPEQCMPLRRLAIHCMLFLQQRPMDPDVGTLLVALENGNVQVWSHHLQGSFITSFSAIHKAGDYVISMTSDENNEFLFTGTSVGYIKTWLLKNYCVPERMKEHINMPKYRLMFPFLWVDFFVSRAARVVRSQLEPILLSCYKGHLLPVSDLTYIDEAKILVSASVDYTARMWTLGGRYLQTLGTFKPWKYVNIDPEMREDFEYTTPPDLYRLGSSTTCRVLRGGVTNRKMTFRQIKAKEKKELTHVDRTKIYGDRLSEPILGHHYKPSIRTTQFHEIKFDTSFPYIPVYQDLIMPTFHEVTMPNVNLKDYDQNQSVTKQKEQAK